METRSTSTYMYIKRQLILFQIVKLNKKLWNHRLSDDACLYHRLHTPPSHKFVRIGRYFIDPCDPLPLDGHNECPG